MPVFFLAILVGTSPPDTSANANSRNTEWNHTVLAALQEHAKTRNTDPKAATDKLVEIADRLAGDRQLGAGNRRRLIAQIQRRLVASGQRVLAQPVGMPPGGAAVGPQSGTEALRDLIEQTIMPDAWDVNGGPGHIHVFRE